ncbi:sugar transferase [Candidatus Kuenenbacteria bacterium]|nr:sugar transferase [Candidatus Kuenenbacteria bacterium]
MKKSELFLTALLIPIDFLMILLAGTTAYFLRFETFFKDIRLTTFIWTFKEYLGLITVVAFIWIIIFALGKLYSIQDIRKKISDEFLKIFGVVSVGMIFIIVYIFFYRELFTSRFIVLSVWILSIFYIFIGRLLIRLLQKWLYKFGYGIHRVIIIGKGREAEIVAAELYKKPTLGYKIVDRIENFDQNIDLENRLLKIKESLNIDEIIQADPSLSKETNQQIIEFCQEHHLVFKYTADLFNAQTSNIEINTIAGIPIIEIKKTHLDGWGTIIKRIFDIVGSFILIIIFSPIMILTALAIKIDSKGPVFFKYKRVGQKGKPFVYFKFRSMIDGAHDLRYTKEWLEKNIRNDGPMIKFENDPRITRVGKFIRKFSIDELAEFFLVLRGRMSLVGPRPHEIKEVEKYQKHHKRLLDIKPGITGMAQVSGRSDLDFEEETRLDTYYIENWSLLLDLKILLKTPLAVFRERETE